MNIFKRLTYFIYPKRCVFCRSLITPGEIYCKNCESTLPFALGVCKNCGNFHCGCDRDPSYDRVVVPLYFEDEVKNAIHRFKFSGHPEMAKPFALLLADGVRRANEADSIDLVTGVPKFGRGYNQSEHLAKEVAKTQGLVFSSGLLMKTRKTKKQRGLTARERRENILGAFACKDPEAVKGRHILICDDVLTTGSTLNECAKVLKKAGARRITCAVIATTKLY